MSSQKSRAFLLSRERENIFDDYYNLIENVKLEDIKQQRENTPDYDILIKALTILERNIDDLASKGLGKENFEEINKLLIEGLTEWLKIVEVLIRQPKFVNAFAYNTLAFAVTIANCERYSLIDIQKDILFLFPSRADIQYYFKHTNREGGEVEKLSNTFFAAYKGIYDLVDDVETLSDYEKISRKLNELINTIEKERTNPYNIRGEFLTLLAKGLYYNIEQDIFPFLSIKSLEEIENVDIENYRLQINDNDIVSIINNIRFQDHKVYEWDIDVVVHGDQFNSSQIGFLMWSISKALESIDGVSILLEDWGNGSKRFSLKAWIKNLFAKEEVKQVLDKGRKAAEAKYLDIPIEEAEKLKAEKEKTIKETENLLDKEQAKEIHELELAKRRLEIEGMATDVALKKLQYVKGLSELIKEGILINDSDFQIMINGLLYVEKQNGKLIGGENIELIEEREIRHNDLPSNQSDVDKVNI